MRLHDGRTAGARPRRGPEDRTGARRRDERGAADPSLTFAISLVAALAMAYPSLSGALAGRLDIMTAGMRYLVALALAWIGAWGLMSLLGAYARGHGAARPVRPALPAPAAAPDHLQRRSEDTPADPSAALHADPAPTPEHAGAAD